jgi:Protein of unknown function (DUF2568)
VTSAISMTPGVASRGAVHHIPASDEASIARRLAIVANLGVRFVVEMAAYAALAYWGVSTGAPPAGRVALAIVAPVSALIVWWMFLAPKAQWHADEPFALVLELAVFAAAAVGLAVSGSAVLGSLLGVVAAGNACVLRVLQRGPVHGVGATGGKPR